MTSACLASEAPSASISLPEYLTANEVADAIRVNTETLRYWRRIGYGPTFSKFGHGPKAPVRYRRDEVLAWLDAQRRTPE